MAQRVVAFNGDQHRGEKYVSHLLVKEVHPVVRLRHQGGFGFAGDVPLRALHKMKKEARVVTVTWTCSQGFPPAEQKNREQQNLGSPIERGSAPALASR